MKKFLIKHTGLPIADLAFEYGIDRDRRVVCINVGDHFDSWLLVNFAKHLEKIDGIRVIDNESHATWGPATVENRFAIELMLAGRLFDVRIVRICRAVQKAGAAPEFTVSMRARKDN